MSAVVMPNPGYSCAGTGWSAKSRDAWRNPPKSLPLPMINAQRSCSASAITADGWRQPCAMGKEEGLCRRRAEARDRPAQWLDRHSCRDCGNTRVLTPGRSLERLDSRKSRSGHIAAAARPGGLEATVKQRHAHDMRLNWLPRGTAGPAAEYRSGRSRSDWHVCFRYIQFPADLGADRRRSDPWR